MPYATRHVVNMLLERSFREGRIDISPMKVQKLLFYVHGWHLATTGAPAIDDVFEAWPYGPVVPVIYQSLKKFGSSAINEYLSDPDGRPLVVNKNQKELYRSLDIAWEKYVGIDAINLSAMTHEPNSPWDICKRNGQSSIPNSIIREYFVRLAS